MGIEREYSVTMYGDFRNGTNCRVVNSRLGDPNLICHTSSAH